MQDIYLAIGMMILLSVGVFALGLALVAQAPRRLCDILGLLIVLVMLIYIREVWDDPILVKLFPVSSVIILGNWFPLMTALLAAIAWRRVPGQIVRRGTCVAALFGVGLYSLVFPLEGSPPQCGNKWQQRISLQTTHATCSPACAATLLTARGIPATEQEMAELCLTREGTYWQGLYRGLKLKTQGTPWDVAVVSGTIDEIRALNCTPVILTVGLPDGREWERRYPKDWGWVPGKLHSVVLLRFDSDGNVSIGDPAVGFEEWTMDELRILWRGIGLCLVPRQEAGRFSPPQS